MFPAILAGIQAAAQLTHAYVALAAEAQGAMSTEDQAALREKLADLRAANDALHARLSMKLEAAAAQV